MDDLTTDAAPIPEVRMSEDGNDGGSQPISMSSSNGNEHVTPIKRLPHSMHLSGCSKVHIGPLYNCIDPASVMTPPPGATSPINSFSMEAKRCPPRHHVEALLACNREINETEMDVTSNHIGLVWKQLGRTMKYSEGQLDNIDADNSRLVDKAYCLVNMWRDRESKKATVANLTRLLMAVRAFDVVMRLRP